MPWDIQKNNYPSNCNRSLFIYFFQLDFGCTTYIHSSFNIHRSLFSCILIASSLSKRRTSMGCRVENQTRACLTARWRTTNWATPHPNCSTPHPTEPRRTLTELCHILTKLCCTLTELRRTLLSYAVPYWATPHPTELCGTLLTYAVPFWVCRTLWATLHPIELCRTLLTYVAPFWVCRTLWTILHPIELCRTLLSCAAP